MTTTAFDDQFTAEPEHVTHRAYDTAAILRQNVADLEKELQRQRERADRAESELKAARINEDCLKCSNRGKTNGLSQESFCDSCIYQGKSWRVNHFSGFSADQQSPAVKYMGRRMSPDGTKECWGFDIGDELPEGTPLYAAPVPAPAVPDANPVQWLEDEGDMILVPRGLLGAACSSIDKQRPAPKVLEALRYYTMNAPQAPAVPTNTIPEGDDFNGTTPHMIRCIESLVAMNDRGALAPHGLCGHSRTLLLASANRLRQQQAHVVPAVPGEWRETLSKLVGIVESSAKFHGCNGVTKQARALLQSAEVTK